MRLAPALDRHADLPVRAPRRGEAAAAGRRRRPDRLRHGRAARGDAGLHPRGARRRRSSRSRPTRPPTACPSCARRSPAGSQRRFGAAARPATRRSSRRSAPRRRSSTSRRCSAASRVVVPAPAYPVYERGAPSSRASEVLELPLRRGARLPARPRRGAAPRPGARSRSCGSTTRTTRRPRPRRSSSTSSAAALAREHDFVARLRRGLLRDLLRRRAARLGARSSPTCATSRSSTRSPSAPRCPATAPGFVAGDPELIALLKRYRPNVGVAPQAFVQRAAVAAWGDEAHVEAVRDDLPRQARRAAAGARGPRPAQRRRRRDVLPLARRGPARRPARRAAARGRDRPRARARSSATRARGYLRLALVPTLAECERAAERLDALLD